MTLHSDEFGRRLSAAASRIKRELSISAKGKVEICIVAFNADQIRAAATVSSDQLRDIFPQVAADCAEVA